MSSLAASNAEDLLGPDDPSPYEVVNGDSTYPVVLVCEHAGRLIPKSLGAMGLSDEARRAHIAWDIGAEAVSRLVAEALGARLVLQRYSRLVIDCNRPPDSDSSMPLVSDAIPVPGNHALSLDARQQRIDTIFEPFQRAVHAQIKQPACRAVLSIHSYTRTMAGMRRPWDIGLLFREDTRTSQALARHFESFVPGDRIGLNQPYQIDDESDWFVPRHGEANGLQHSLIEICNDLIDTSTGQRRWAENLSTVISQFVRKDMT